MKSFRDLLAYQKAFEVAMKIFVVTKLFPAEEKYSLIDQIRRGSRSVCANVAEGYRKRRYVAHFIAKLTDADMENSKTQVWLEFALRCKYIDETTFDNLVEASDEVGKLINYMIQYPDKFSNK
jgi:four helix bundle protein